MLDLERGVTAAEAALDEQQRQPILADRFPQLGERRAVARQQFEQLEARRAVGAVEAVEQSCGVEIHRGHPL